MHKYSVKLINFHLNVLDKSADKVFLLDTFYSFAWIALNLYLKFKDFRLWLSIINALQVEPYVVCFFKSVHYTVANSLTQCRRHTQMSCVLIKTLERVVILTWCRNMKKGPTAWGTSSHANISTLLKLICFKLFPRDLFTRTSLSPDPTPDQRPVTLKTITCSLRLDALHSISQGAALFLTLHQKRV